MKKHKLAITTTSLIRTPTEGITVLKTIEVLSALNIPVIIADGGSPQKQKQIIKNMPNIILLEEKGLTNQLKESFVKGADIANSLFYLHTDKLDFVQKYAHKLIDNYLDLKTKGMLIPIRTAAAFNTYPKYQRELENFLNYMISDYCGKKADYYFGPKIFSSKLVSYLDRVRKDIKWGIEAYFYTINHRLKLPMHFYKVNVNAPKEVLTDDFEFKKYRLELIKWQIDGLILGQQVDI